MYSPTAIQTLFDFWYTETVYGWSQTITSCSMVETPYLSLTPAARAALQWRRSRNEKVVAVPALVRFHLTFSCILPTASRLQRTALTTSTLHQCRWNIESVSHLEQIEACESRARKQ